MTIWGENTSTICILAVSLLTGCAARSSGDVSREPRPSVVCEASDPSSDAETVVAPGDTLDGIATRRYGHRSYAQLVKLYNRIESETALESGTTLRTPDLRHLLLAENPDPTVRPVVDWICCARSKFARARTTLWELSRADSPDGRLQLSDDVAAQLVDVAADLRAAAEALGSDGHRGKSVPERTIGQLEQVRGIVEDLATGRCDENGYDIDLVDQRLALAMTNFVLWAREK